MIKVVISSFMNSEFDNLIGTLVESSNGYLKYIHVKVVYTY